MPRGKGQRPIRGDDCGFPDPRRPDVFRIATGWHWTSMSGVEMTQVQSLDTDVVEIAEQLADLSRQLVSVLTVRDLERRTGQYITRNGIRSERAKKLLRELEVEADRLTEKTAQTGKPERTE